MKKKTIRIRTDKNGKKMAWWFAGRTHDGRWLRMKVEEAEYLLTTGQAIPDTGKFQSMLEYTVQCNKEHRKYYAALDTATIESQHAILN